MGSQEAWGPQAAAKSAQPEITAADWKQMAAAKSLLEVLDVVVRRFPGRKMYTSNFYPCPFIYSFIYLTEGTVT